MSDSTNTTVSSLIAAYGNFARAGDYRLQTRVQAVSDCVTALKQRIADLTGQKVPADLLAALATVNALL